MGWRRRRSQNDYAEEIRAHLELEQSQLESEGIGTEEARATARRAFGNVAAAQERYHERGRWLWSDFLLKDVAYALRMLRKTPWFTAAAILILAFAIGANLAVFGLIDALMLRSIPVPKPEELVRIDPVGPQGRLNGMNSGVLDALRKEPVFSGVCGFTTPRVTTNINGVVASTGTLSMTGDCFQTLGARTQIGRPFTIADDLPEAPNVVVLTARLWRSAFGGATTVLGKKIQAGSETFTVIGVAADDFTGVLLGFEPGLLVPLHHTPADVPQRRFVDYWVSVFARRAEGIPEASVEARIGTISARLLEQSVPHRYNPAQRRNYLANHLVVSSARTGADWMLRGRFGQPLFALLGICGAILLIACLNLAGLLVARTLARQKELGIRLAIGATLWRVMRPLAFESLLLAIGGGVAGVLFASWARRAIIAEASAMFTNFSIDSSLDARAVTLLAGVVAWVAVILTVVPIWQALRSRKSGNLHEPGRGIIGDNGRTQKTLIGIQVAFTLALVTASGVFASSFNRLAHMALGLRAQGVSEAMLSPLPGGYGLANPTSYYAGLLQEVASVPGVQSASLSSFALYWHKLYPDLVRVDDGSHELRAQTIKITDGYFQTLSVRLRTGEDFNRNSSEPEAIVSESVAEQLGGRMPGQYILIGENGSVRRYHVIGVAPTMRISMEDVREPSPLAVYLNFWQDPKEQRYPVLLVRGVNDAQSDGRAIGIAVQSFGREYIEEFRSLAAQREEAIVEDRLLAYLSSIFGLLGLLLAAIGLFAILSCYVSRRTSEIGVRMALGADAAQIGILVLRQIGFVVLAGIMAGLGLALVVGRMLGSVAYGVTPRDPLLLGGAALALMLTAFAAALIPARRATSIQPLAALRHN